MKKFKPYILPAAIVLGIILHNQSKWMALAVPYVIFTILLLNFTAVDLKKMRPKRLDIAIMLFQTVMCIALYAAVKAFGGGETLAQGALISVLCPVASSVVVVAAELGADRRLTTPYTIYGNLLVAVIAPVIFSFVGVNQDMPLMQSAWIIFKKISAVIALPFFIAIAMQIICPKLKEGISRYKGWALPLWAFALLATLGQTIDYIYLYHQGNVPTIIALAITACCICAMQFAVGRWLGDKTGCRIAGGQLTGQKNTAIGIWMASIYLNPLSSVALAFYSVAQNLFNSYQMYKAAKR